MSPGGVGGHLWLLSGLQPPVALVSVTGVSTARIRPETWASVDTRACVPQTRPDDLKDRT